MYNENVHIIDFYNPQIYPGDNNAKTAIKTIVHVYNSDDDSLYLKKMRDNIPHNMDSFKPDFVLYNAGI